jgi:hypothetical protein
VAIERRSDVQDAIAQRIVWCFWTGDNEMSDQRRQCLDKMAQGTECNVVFVAKTTLANFVCPSHPLHPAYQWLSATHRADYLRAYFLFHYGGGYSDIKMQTGSWVDSFETMEAHKQLTGIGYREVPGGVPGHLTTESGSPLGECWPVLIGNGAYIFRRDTEFLRLWFTRLHQVLDLRSRDLMLHPARFPQDYRGVEHGGSVSEYPLWWSAILADIFHPICYQLRNEVMNTLPMPVCRDYR